MIKVLWRLLLMGVILLFVAILLHHLFPQSFEKFLAEGCGAALGGMFGGFLVWYLRDTFVNYRKRPERVVTYYVADSETEIYGNNLKCYDRGVKIKAQKIKEALGFNSCLAPELLKKGIYEFKRLSTDGKKYNMAFYGPYSFDVAEPGTYEASFHYFGRGFDKDRALDPLLFAFDVMLKEGADHHTDYYEQGMKLRTKNIAKRKIITKSKRYLHYSDFCNDNEYGFFRNFCNDLFRRFLLVKRKETCKGRIAKLRFYYPGAGDLEFRAYIHQGDPQGVNNVVNYLLNGHRIFFYKVVVHRIYDVEVPESL